MVFDASDFRARRKYGVEMPAPARWVVIASPTMRRGVAKNCFDAPADTAGNSTLAYDASSDTYQYVWKTDSSWAGTCRQLVVQLNDGSLHTAYFRFR